MSSTICIMPFVITSPRETPVESLVEAISTTDPLAAVFHVKFTKDVGKIDEDTWKLKQIRRGFEPEDSSVAEICYR
jgi:aminoglycoside N3'-acetyltransferase